MPGKFNGIIDVFESDSIPLLVERTVCVPLVADISINPLTGNHRSRTHDANWEPFQYIHSFSGSL